MASNRFSAEHIRRQPEYQYLITKQANPGKVSINLNDLSLRIIQPTKEDKLNDSSNGSPTQSCKPLLMKRDKAKCRPLTTSSASPSSCLSVMCSTMNSKKVYGRPKTAAARNESELETMSYTASPMCTNFRRSLSEMSSAMNNTLPYGMSTMTTKRKQSVLQREYDVRNVHSSEQLHLHSVNYDPSLDKTHQFLKGFGSSFSQASQALVPIKRGLSKVEVHYSESNLNQNDSFIFADLIKNSHRSNMIFQESVGGLERRLLTKRDHLKRATTFYDTILKPPTTYTLRSARNRTVAGKKDERNKRIKIKNKKIELGYEPRAWTLHAHSEEEFKKVLECRYLRVSPKYQPELYGIESSDLMCDANTTEAL